MPPTRRLADEPADHPERPAGPAPPGGEPPAHPERRAEPAPQESALLALQRSAGNAAVSRLLARQPVLDITKLPPGTLDDWTAAGQTVDAFFDSVAKDHRESLAIPGTVAELVHQACEEELTLKDGSKAKV